MTSVDLWPDSDDRQDPVWVFTARCSAIFELYSLHLKSGPPLAAVSSSVRVFVHNEPFAAGPGPWIQQRPPHPGDFDSIHCQPHTGILAAARSDWPMLYLEWLHLHLLALADVRGWPTQPLESARQACLHDELRLHLTSRTKSSPDRRHMAHLELHIDAAGDRHPTLTVTDRSGRTVAQSTEVAPALRWGVRDFRAAARHLRWEDPGHVVADDRWRIGDGPWQPPLHAIEVELPPSDDAPIS